MSLRINPQTINVFPEDRQAFEATATPDMALWYNTTNATINANGSVTATNPANPVIVYCALNLMVSGGFFEWIFDTSCIPTGTFPTGGQLRVEARWNSEANGYGYCFAGDGSGIITNGSAAVLVPSFVPNAGDRFRMEVTGGRLITRNGVLFAQSWPPSFSGAGATTFPAILRVELRPGVVSGTPRIPPFAIGGDWRLVNGVTWNAPAAGSLTASSGTKTTFFNITTPGEVDITALVGGSTNQQASGRVTVPPLTMLGSTSVTMQPGEKRRFKVNYDFAQNDIVIWSVITGGGGSFDAGDVYTAPTAPGTYNIRAEYSTTQDLDIFVTVPGVITPSYIGVEPGEVVNWDSNIAATQTWSASAGSINSSSGLWTAPSVVGQIVRITVTNGTLTVTKDVAIVEKFPYDPNAIIKVEVGKKVLISEAEDGTRATRVKNFGGNSQAKYELNFANRDLAEFEAARAFWARSYPGQPILISDKVRNVRVVGYIDSDLSYEVEASCAVSYAFTFLEKA